MAQRKITQDLIVRQAQALIEEQGFDNFSLRELAYRLGVQPSSLYNHLKNVSSLRDAIALLALEEMQGRIEAAVKDIHGREALLRIARTIRTFSQERPELFRSIESGGRLEATGAFFAPTKEVLKDFALTEEEKDKFTNAFHAAIFGFLLMERRHMLLRAEEADHDFVTMVGLLTSGLRLERQVN